MTNQLPPNPGMGCVLALVGFLLGALIAAPLMFVSDNRDWLGMIAPGFAIAGFVCGCSHLWLLPGRDLIEYQAGRGPFTPLLRRLTLAIAAYVIVLLVALFLGFHFIALRRHEIHLTDARSSGYVKQAYKMCEEKVREQLQQGSETLTIPYGLFDYSKNQDDSMKPKLDGDFLDHGEIVELRFASWADVKDANNKTTRLRWSATVRAAHPVWRDLEKIKWIVERVDVESR